MMMPVEFTYITQIDLAPFIHGVGHYETSSFEFTTTEVTFTGAVCLQCIRPPRSSFPTTPLLLLGEEVHHVYLHRREVLKDLG